MQPTKHHYLKLPEDFFKQDKIAILENSKNGFLFSNILLKMYLLSLKNNGELLLAEDVPYTCEMLAQLTGHKIATIEQALARFKELDLMKETENKSLSMTDLQLFSESITLEGERKRAYRSKKKLGQNEECVPTLSHECPTDVPDVSPESPVDVTDLSQTCHEYVPPKGEDCPPDVPESSYTPFSIVPPRSQKKGEFVLENLATPTRKLLKPPKGGRPKKSEVNSQIENEPEAPTTPEEAKATP